MRPYETSNTHAYFSLRGVIRERISEAMHPIRRLRTKVLKISQSAMAEAANVTQATVSRWESGELEPSLSELLAIKAKYGRRVNLSALQAKDQTEIKARAS